MTEESVRKVLRRVELALKKSPNPTLRKMSFVRPPRGGASPVFSRKSVKSRYIPEQKKIIVNTIKALHQNGQRPSDRALKLACIRALKKEGLLSNVKLHLLRIRAIKLSLNLTSHKPKKRRKVRVV